MQSIIALIPLIFELARGEGEEGRGRAGSKHLSPLGVNDSLPNKYHCANMHAQGGSNLKAGRVGFNVIFVLKHQRLQLMSQNEKIVLNTVNS